MPIYSIRYKSPTKTRGRTIYHAFHTVANNMEQARRKFKRETPLLEIHSIKRVKRFVKH